ncbi:MAG TPA: aminotransferase class V-fold PLP-dependent enzyme [Pyrinomonadaceae bacterium]|nr:aminotransferase class V-fold PLP-dependent enzyme [Pyrinomonadaceae bacterium]
MTEVREAPRVGEIDWARLRADFPVTREVAYLNSAASGPVANVVRDEATRFYDELMAEGDRRWEEWLERREAARQNIARLINAEPDEVGFTTNTSSGMHLICDALETRGGGVISCELEFPVTTIPWLHRGRDVKFLKAADGVVAAEDVRRAMTDSTSVICLSHVQFSNGLRTDIEAVGREKGRHALVVNAAQSAGVLPIDVKRMRVDALCATGHKWMLAGYGSGFVYMSRELLAGTRPRSISWMSVEHPFAMRNDSYRVRPGAGARAETGVPHFAGIFALGASADYLLRLGPSAVERRALELNRRMTEALTEAGWRVLSPLRDEATRSAETLVEAQNAGALVRHLAARGVAVTVKPEGFRAATHFFNDDSDVARLVEALSEWRRAGGI